MDDCPDSFAYLVMALITSHLYIPPRQLIYIPFFSIFFVTCITNGVSFLLIVLLTSQHLVHCFRYPYTYNTLLSLSTCISYHQISICFSREIYLSCCFPSLKKHGRANVDRFWEERLLVDICIAPAKYGRARGNQQAGPCFASAL